MSENGFPGTGGTSLKKHIRVAFLVQGLGIGGLERVVVAVVTQLCGQQFSPVIICYDTLGEYKKVLEQSGVRTIFLPRKTGVDCSYLLKLARLLRQEKVDVLNTHNDTALFYGTIAGRLAGISRLVYTEHDGRYPKDRAKSFLNWGLLRLNHRVIAVARYLKDNLIQYHGVSPTKITVINNGVRELSGSVDTQRELREQLSLASSSPVLGIVARLDPVKNHRFLFQSVHELLPELPGLKLIVVGGGPEEENLRRLVREQGLDGTVLMVGQQENIADWYSLFDIFVLTSKSEGLSLTLIEALAAGLPIVTTDVGGNSEVVEHGFDGFLIPPDDKEAFKRAVLKVARDGKLCQTFSRNGRQRFQEHFSLSRMVKAYETVFSGER